MRAGSEQLPSVRPLKINEIDGDADDERIEVDPTGEKCERIGLGDEEKSVRKLLDPLLPSEKEVDEHWVRGHVPFRNWCETCVRARGREMDHTKLKGSERRLPEYSFDYCFPGDEFGFKWIVLVGKEKMSKSFFATAVPQKGASGKFASDKCIEFMDENGDAGSKVIVKTDQEPSIEYLKKDIIQDRPEGRTILENSPVKSSGSNGVVERGVQEIEGQIRILLLGFESRLGRRVDSRERIIGFMPEYAAYLLNRLHVGEDGKVPYERMKGKKPTILGLEFGEMLLYKCKKGAKKECLNARWEKGVFVGIQKNEQ